jgi:DNA-directed RNA polymerase specialized sigma24 family protein
MSRWKPAGEGYVMAIAMRGNMRFTAARKGGAGHIALQRKLDEVSESLFDMIVVKEIGPATALASRMLGDYATAADVVFMALDRAREEFALYNGAESPREWVLRYVAEEAVRRSAVQEPRRDCEASSRADVRAALHCLGPEPRLAVILKDVLGMTDETAAHISGVDAGSLRSRVAAAREWLSRHLTVGHGGPAADGALG